MHVLIKLSQVFASFSILQVQAEEVEEEEEEEQAPAPRAKPARGLFGFGAKPVSNHL